MVETSGLYLISDAENIPVLPFSLPKNGSMCIQTNEFRCYIGIDYSVLADESSLRVHLAHELGHCEVGAFYNRWAACDIRQQHENRADKWAIQQLVPEDELNAAVADGDTEIWSLAEHFDVTEEFMKKAVCWYTHGNLAVDLYF